MIFSTELLNWRHMETQAAIGAASGSSFEVKPHHPITCRSTLRLDPEDGTFTCEHTQVPITEKRTRACINHSIAILILEVAFHEL